MTNPNFTPETSTNQIYRDQNMSQCLTDDLDNIESTLADKASATHAHSDYATASHVHSGYAETSHTHAQSDVSDLATALGAKADLVDGKVPASQLPSYVSDIVEAASLSAFPATGEADRIYVAQDTNLTYRWGGTGYVEVSQSIAIGETASTAHRGDHGKTAYDHSQSADVHVTADQKTAWDGKAEGNHTHVVYSGVSTYKKVWIATTGSDDNVGTAAAPMATIAGAIRKYAPQYKMLDISLADGTYTENIGPVSADLVNLAIRSNSEDKDKVTINMTSALEVNVNIVRLYNITLNVTVTGVRPLVVTGGLLYAYNVRCNVPTDSTHSCVNVYNGCSAFLMHCVLNSGISGLGACLYGNQATMIKAINCTTERTVALACYAHNGSEIQYTDTMTATTKEKESYYGKCNVIS